MHITIDCRMWGNKFGGIGRYTKEIVLRLFNHPHWKFTLLCSAEVCNDLEPYQNETIHLVSCSAKIFSLKEQWEIWRKVPRCDLFWCPYMNVPFLKTRAERSVVTLHDVFHVANPQYYSRLKHIIIAPYYFFSTHNSDLILTVSHFSKSEIEKYFGKCIAGKVKVVYNGCEIHADDILPQKIEKKYFLFVGSIKPHKNLKNALLGFQKLGDKDYQFIIVGKKEGFITADYEVHDLVIRINQQGEKVLFTGNIDDRELYAWYKGASALVMPSFYEGFGLPLVEAMYFNIPIICSDIPALKEIGKEFVRYFNPHSIDDICYQMQEIIQQHKQVKYPSWRSWQNAANDIATLFEALIIHHK